MNQVGLKLEAAIKSYLAANYQSSGMEFNGVTLYLGHTPEVQTTRSKVGILAGTAGGPHVNVGNYEIPVSFTIITSMEKTAGTETEAALRLAHGERVEAINGIFAESRVATVTAALVALDAELGVSAYWPESQTDEHDEIALRTVITKVFEAYLA